MLCHLQIFDAHLCVNSRYCRKWHYRHYRYKYLFCVRSLLSEKAKCCSHASLLYLLLFQIATLQDLKNPNIIEIVEAFVSVQYPSLCIVMEYCEGGSLHDQIKAQGGTAPFSVKQAIMVKQRRHNSMQTINPELRHNHSQGINIAKADDICQNPLAERLN